MRLLALGACAVMVGACSATGPAAGQWRAPEAGATWHWQLTGDVVASHEVAVYDVDGFETDAATVERLHRDGRYVVCYLSAGSVERWRPDAERFPDEVVGEPLAGWPGERWLDVRRLDVLLPVMADRFDMCADKGFDAVEADNVEAWSNDSGFDVTAADQRAYDRALARLAHERGLAFGLKNDLDQAAELVADMDFAVVEQCVEFQECALTTPFVEAGKAVLVAEYDVALDPMCEEAGRRGLSAALFPVELDGGRVGCPG